MPDWQWRTRKRPGLLAVGLALTPLWHEVVEARNPSGDLFGFEHARSISAQSAVEIAAAAQAHGQEDDITVLTLTFASAERLVCQPGSPKLTNSRQRAMRRTAILG
jgi:hypothetical protein